MPDLPILMSAPMIRAILREIEAPGTGKTQTRRMLNPQPPFDGGVASGVLRGNAGIAIYPEYIGGPGGHFVRPRYSPGDRLYVRETWRAWSQYDDWPPSRIPAGVDVQYVADDPLSVWDSRHRQAMHMPRWASRITLLVTKVRVERLLDISEADARAEGAMFHDGRPIGHHGWRHDFRDVFPTAKHSFANLWNSLHGSDAWAANPWVCAITFRPVIANIDSIGGEA